MYIIEDLITVIKIILLKIKNTRGIRFLPMSYTYFKSLGDPSILDKMCCSKTRDVLLNNTIITFITYRLKMVRN